MSWLNQPYQGGYGQQPGFPQGIQPQQTGFVPQQLQGQRTGYQPQLQPQLQPQPQQQFAQPTGYGALRPQMPLQGQPTGFAPMGMQQRPMATGYSPQQFQQQQPPVFQQQPPAFQQQPSFNGGLQSQFITTFLPAQTIQPTPYMQPSQMQFAVSNNTGPSLQQSFQQSNQAQIGQTSVAIPWALTADEKKRYDQIFRAWDQQGAGFIGGAVAKEVFGQAGLDKDDLMAIWNLADVEDRGRLNIDEFHVAMGLIYRRLNGNPIPPVLPEEMKPPSARDLNDSVGFLQNLLKNDNHSRSTNLDGGLDSRAKARTLHGTAAAPNRKDATVYRHDDGADTVYKSKSRHIDRDAVTYSGSGRGTPTSELEQLKRDLNKGKSLVEQSRGGDDEEDDLKDELRSLKRKIQRLNDDLEDNIRSGRRTAAKDDERRKFERELLRLEHEDLPALQRKLEDKERDKRRDTQKYALERDSRNSEHEYGRRGASSYSTRDRSRSRDRNDYQSSSREPDDLRERPRGYERGSYDDEARRPSRRESPPPRA
ncbi:hypothetical protein P7C70_g4201, partial [Phenoliferia sp. Uapishka_3]